MILRQLSSVIQSAAQTMPLVSITGPRQSGKTTLAKYAFPDYAYANLENPPTRQFARETIFFGVCQYRKSKPPAWKCPELGQSSRF